MSERRQYVRITFFREVTVARASGATMLSNSYDFSMYGMGLHTDVALENDEIILLDFKIHGADAQRQINLRGRVVYSSKTIANSPITFGHESFDGFNTGIQFC